MSNYYISLIFYFICGISYAAGFANIEFGTANPHSPSGVRKVYTVHNPQEAIELILTLRERFQAEKTLYLFDYDGVIAGYNPKKQGNKCDFHRDARGLRLPVCNELLDLFKKLRKIHPNHVHILSAGYSFITDSSDEKEHEDRGNLELDEASEHETFSPNNWNREKGESSKITYDVYCHSGPTPLFFAPKLGFSTYDPSSLTGNKGNCLGPILKALDAQGIEIESIVFIDDHRGYVDQIIGSKLGSLVNIYGIHMSGSHSLPEIPEIYQPDTPFP